MHLGAESMHMPEDATTVEGHVSRLLWDSTCQWLFLYQLPPWHMLCCLFSVRRCSNIGPFDSSDRPPVVSGHSTV